jgi:hypothetical protein
MSLKEACWRLIISVHEAEKLSLEAMSRFVEAGEDIRFEKQKPPASLPFGGAGTTAHPRFVAGGNLFDVGFFSMQRISFGGGICL